MATSEQIIDEITDMLVDSGKSYREVYRMRETLRGLVRLAQSEYRQDMQRSVRLAQGNNAGVAPKLPARKPVPESLSFLGNLGKSSTISPHKP